MTSATPVARSPGARERTRAHNARPERRRTPTITRINAPIAGVRRRIGAAGTCHCVGHLCPRGAGEGDDLARSRAALWVTLGDTRNMPTRAASSAASSIGCSSPQTLPPVWIVEATATGAPPTGGSALDAVAEVHDTVVEPVFLQQRQLCAGVGGKRRLALTDEQRIDEELILIDQPGV